MRKFLSLALVLVLVATVFTGCNKEDKEPGFNDGTYTGEATGMNPLKVSVEVADGKISNVTVTEQDETVGMAEPALEGIPAAIVEKNSTEVDSVSGATITSDAIKEAVDNALEGAK